MAFDWNNSLATIGDAMQPMAQQGIQRSNDQLMSKVFAINPTFGQQYYGEKNDASTLAMTQEEVARKRKQQEALKLLAAQLATGNLKDPVQRQTALAQYGAITGDLEPMLGVGDDNTPSAIKEWQQFSAMTPEMQAQYLTMKRANQVINLGGTQEIRSPTGAVVESLPVTLKPEDQPGNAANKAAAIEAAKLGEQLVLEPQITAANKAAELEQVAAADLIKKAKGAETTIQILSKAEKLLPKATGSAVGSALASGKSALGISDESTQANTDLELLSGWLTSNIPRMEGPQSNFDVENYRKMAADLGNRSKPIEDRMAALRTLRDLQMKYADINTDRPSAGTPSNTVKRFNPATGRIE